MKKKNILIERFFQATGEGDEKFLEALWNLRGAEMRAGQRGKIGMREQPIAYDGAEARDVDGASCSVGEALKEALVAKGLKAKQAAEDLGVSDTMMRGLLAEMIPLTAKTTRFVAAFLSEKYQGASQKLLADQLLNGLHYWELKNVDLDNPRMAARRKERPGDRKKP